jgi:hypothetical protein
LFQKVLSLCIEKGMVKGKRQAIDSAYIKANFSMDSLQEKQVVNDTEQDKDRFKSAILVISIISIDFFDNLSIKKVFFH